MPRTALLALALALVTSGGAACGGSAQDAPAATPKPAEPDEPAHGGDDDYATIDVFCSPPVKVLVDGKPAGTTPISGFKVKPGKHDVTCVDDTGNRTMGVNLGPGEGTTVTSDRPPSMQEQKQPDKGDKAKKP
jgi:hypothetical protein